LDKPREIDWEKIQSKDNHSIEELTYEEQQILKEYERQQSEQRDSGMPPHIARLYGK
jgi:hypothetical protein